MGLDCYSGSSTAPRYCRDYTGHPKYGDGAEFDDGSSVFSLRLFGAADVDVLVIWQRVLVKSYSGEQVEISQPEEEAPCH